VAAIIRGGPQQRRVEAFILLPKIIKQIELDQVFLSTARSFASDYVPQRCDWVTFVNNSSFSCQVEAFNPIWSKYQIYIKRTGFYLHEITLFQY